MSLKPPAQTDPVICLVRSLGVMTALLLGSCTADTLNGRVILSGSATLAPAVEQALQDWKHRHPRVEVRVEAIGSDAGLEKLIGQSSAELALISRPLTDRDQAGRDDLVALPLAWDAICLAVAADARWVPGLTREQTAQVFTTAALWSDIAPSLPRRPIHRFVLGPESGTATLFSEAILGGSKTLLFTAPQTQTSEDDRILARGVAQIDGAIGFLGWGTVQSSQPPLRALALDGIEPTPKTIRNRTYPLARQLWLVVPRQILPDRPEVRSLVSFLVSRSGVLASEARLVAVSPEETKILEQMLTDLNQ